jgi:dienelactone hydrolase
MNHSLLLLAILSSPALAALVQKPVAYDIGKTKFEGVLIHDDASKTPKPGLVLVPNWLGINAANLKQAELIASRGYSVFVADLYGKEARPKSQEEAGKAAGAVKGDRKLMRERMAKALEVLKASAKAANVDVNKLGAIGFCFGGTAALELARAGGKVAGVVSFHGGLDTTMPADAKTLSAKVLVLHGADDPNVPPKDVDAFQAEMRAAKADWQLVAYGNSVHSFTDVDAKMPGKAEYNATTAKRAYEAMDRFFAEIFGAPN